MSQVRGILAVWNDCDRRREAEYEHWYRAEHLPERVGVPGFRLGRRYEAVGSAAPRFFTYYELDAPEVLVSAAYLERYNNPTPLTRRIMGEKVFRNASRTACRRTRVRGALRGAFALAVRWSDARMLDAEGTRLAQLAHNLVEEGLAVRTELWEAEADATGIASVEQDLRGGPDQVIAGAVLLETARDAELAEVLRRVAPRLAEGMIAGAYRLLCSLEHRELGARSSGD